MAPSSTTPAGQPRPRVRARARGAGLQGMRALLSVRARRAAGAARSISRRSMRRSPMKACARRRMRSRRSSRTGNTVYQQPTTSAVLGRLGRPRRVLPAQDHAAGRAAARHGAARSVTSRRSSPARPAPPTTRTTPGSSASPTTSRWRCGSATTTRTASAARSAAGQTGAKVAMPIFEQIIQAAWTHHAPKVALAPPRPRRSAAWSRCRSTLRPAIASPAARARSWNSSVATASAGCRTRSSCWSRRSRPMRIAAIRAGADGEAAGGWWGDAGNRPFAGGGGYPYWRDPSPGVPRIRHCVACSASLDGTSCSQPRRSGLLLGQSRLFN